MRHTQDVRMMNQAFRDDLYRARQEYLATDYETEWYSSLSVKRKTIYNCFKVRNALWEQQNEQNLPEWEFVYPDTEDYGLVAVFWNKRKPSVGGIVRIQLYPTTSLIIMVFVGQRCRPWGWMPLHLSGIAEREELDSLLEALFFSLRIYGKVQQPVRYDAVKAS